MMKGDSNLTFFLTQESGPKSPREGQGDVCMVSLYSDILKFSTDNEF